MTDYNGMYDEFKTTELEREVGRCEDIEELKESVFPKIKSQQEQWIKKINEIIAESGLNKTQFADALGVSRMAVNKWCNGAIPKNRETFIEIGMIAGYDREKMDALLQRYGQYPALYPKSLVDCVCIFVLGQNYGKEALSQYKYILEKIKEMTVNQSELSGTAFLTEDVGRKLSEVKTQSELEKFIADNAETFQTSYHKFYSYVNQLIKQKVTVLGAENVYDLSIIQDWSASLKQTVSAISQKKWYPTRNKIISLGIHLNLEHEDINDLLSLAHMEPLCAKNAFESVIIFLLEDAGLNDMFDITSEYYDPFAILDRSREVLKCFDLPEIESFISEFPEEDYELL